jgi:hypothetical protein
MAWLVVRLIASGFGVQNLVIDRPCCVLAGSIVQIAVEHEIEDYDTVYLGCALSLCHERKQKCQFLLSLLLPANSLSTLYRSPAAKWWIANMHLKAAHGTERSIHLVIWKD